MEKDKAQDSVFNDMQIVKRRLFAMRNGIIADTLRKAGSPFRIIFGVNLPQLVEIAKETGKDSDLAERLWANDTTRESMLLAPMLMPAEKYTYEDACRWIEQVPTAEVADILCHRLLRHQPYALQLAQQYADSETPILRYCGLRLMCNIARDYPTEARAIGERELKRNNQATQLIAMQLAEYE